MANEPWSTRGRSKYIGLPICARTVPASPPLTSSSSSSSYSDEDRWFTPASYFATDMEGGPGYVELSIAGTFSGTVTLQRSFDDGLTWHDVSTYTEETEATIMYGNRSVKYRLGVKDGEWTSGSAELRLSQAG